MTQVALTTTVRLQTRAQDVRLRILIDSKGIARIEAFGRSLALIKTDTGFGAVFEADSESDALVLSPADAARALGLGDMAKVLEPLGALPINKLALINHVGGDTGDEKSSFGVALGMGPTLDLASLPLVGGLLPTAAYGLGDLTLTWATDAISAQDLGPLAVRFPDGFTLPAAPSIAAVVRMGKGRAALLQAGATDASTDRGDDDAGPDDAEDDTTDKGPRFSHEGGTAWVRVGKSLGPVTVKRVGLRWADGVVYAPMDVSVMAGPLSMTLLGAALGLSFDRAGPRPQNYRDMLGHLRPHFTLDGVAISYNNPQVSISGALKRQPGKGLHLVGSMVIETSSFSISAIGAYKHLPGKDPSFFVFGVLNKELGGPPFFRVQGLAAGFGLNQRFVTGPVDQVKHHPLVEFAARKTPIPADEVLEQITPKLDQYLPDAPGAMWFTIGVKGSTFGLIDTFLMLTLLMEEDISVSVLGLSTLELPPQPPHAPGTSKTISPEPIARIVLQISSNFAPDTGKIEINARIAGGSYLFSPECHLTGGMAFCTWVKGEHSGDFALTIGGWHGDFTVPAHYPTPPRVALDWAVTPYLALHGELYFGLTPSCVMAGGMLSATYRRGEFRASFFVSADFLMNWEPFHYQFDITVRISVSYTIVQDTYLFGTARVPIRLTVSTVVSLWGPPFGGVATVKTPLKDFSIDFGAGRQSPDPVGWTEIREKYLPSKADFAALSVTKGLLHEQQVDGHAVQIVSPKRAQFELRSAVPLTSAHAKGIDHKSSGQLGLRPAATAVPAPYIFGTPYSPSASSGTGTWQAGMKVNIVAEDGSGDVSDQFEVEPILSNVPAAIWGEGPPRAGPSRDMIKDVVTGLRFAIKRTDLSDTGTVVALSAYAEKKLTFHIGWAKTPALAKQLAGDERPDGICGLEAAAPLITAAAQVFGDLAGVAPDPADADTLRRLIPHTYRCLPRAARLGAFVAPASG